MSAVPRCVCAIAIALLVATACTRTDDAETSLPAPAVPETLAYRELVTVGFAASDLSDSRVQDIAAGARAAANGLDVRLVVLDAHGEHAGQREAVERFVGSALDAILIDPVDSTAAVELVELASEAGIPVVAVDNQIGAVENFGAQYVYPGLLGLVSHDDFDIGRVAAGSVLGPIGAKIAFVGIRPGAANDVARIEGFSWALDALGVAHEIAIRSTSADATSTCAALHETKDLDIVVAMTARFAAECLVPIERLGMEVQILSLGSDADIARLVDHARIDASVCQSPRSIGAVAIDLIDSAAKGEESGPALRLVDAIGLSPDTARRCSLRE